MDGAWVEFVVLNILSDQVLSISVKVLDSG